MRAATSAAKALLVDAYAAGGSIEFVNEMDRTALRLNAPKWALTKIVDDVPAVVVDYLALTDPRLGPAPRSGEARLLIAARVGSTRLIDNIGISLYERQ